MGSTRRSNDVFSEFLVGIFMTVVLAVLVYFTIVISGVDLFFGRECVQAKIAFTDVGGLKERDSVMFRGMKVGSVERIVLGDEGITVIALIDKDVVLRTGSRISVADLSLLGGNYLLLEEGAGEIVSLADTLFKGEAPVDWMRDIGAVARNLNELTSSGGIKSLVANLDEAASNVNRIVSRIERGEGTMGKLLSTNDAIYVDLAATIASAKSAASSIDDITTRLARGEGTVGKLLSTNDTVYANLSETLENASKISARLERGEGTVGKLLSTNDEAYVELRATLANAREITDKINSGKGILGRLSSDEALADDVSKMLSNLKSFSSKLEKGEGTIGKLLTDSKMYDEITALVKDLRQIVDNYRDTTPITTFGSLATGAL